MYNLHGERSLHGRLQGTLYLAFNSSSEDLKAVPGPSLSMPPLSFSPDAPAPSAHQGYPSLAFNKLIYWALNQPREFNQIGLQNSNHPGRERQQGQSANGGKRCWDEVAQREQPSHRPLGTQENALQILMEQAWAPRQSRHLGQT